MPRCGPPPRPSVCGAPPEPVRGAGEGGAPGAAGGGEPPPSPAAAPAATAAVRGGRGEGGGGEGRGGGHGCPPGGGCRGGGAGGPGGRGGGGAGGGGGGGLHGRGGRVGGAGCRGVRRGGASGARGGRRGAPRWRALLPRPHCLPAVPLRRRVRAGARAGALGRARGLWGLRLPGVGRGGPRRCERAGGRRLQRLVCCVFFPWGRAFVEDCHSPGGSSFLQCTSVTVVRGPGVGRSRHALDLRGSGRLLPWEM